MFESLKEKAKQPKSSTGTDAPKGTSAEEKASSPLKTDGMAMFWKLAAASKVTLDETEVRRRSLFPVHVFQTREPSDLGPPCQTELKGDASISLISAPQYIQGAALPFDESKAFKLAFEPREIGQASATLEVTTLGPGLETLRIPIVGWARAPGAPTHVEEEAEVAKKKSDEKKRQDEAAEHDRADKAAKRVYAQNHTHHEGAKAELERARDQAESSVDHLYQRWGYGISVGAANEIGTFKRRKVPDSPSLLEDLAFSALAIGTGAIAGALAKRLEPLVAKAFSGHTSLRDGVAQNFVPSAAFVAFVTDGLKASVREAGRYVDKGLHGAIKPSEPKRSDRAHDPIDEAGANVLVSLDPKAYFLLEQTRALNPSVAKDGVHAAADALLPMIETPTGVQERPKHADEAIAAMRRTKETFDAEGDNAANVQMDATVRGWVTYLARTSVGALGREQAQRQGLAVAGDGVVLDAAAASARSKESFDGLIDIMFHAKEVRPDRPVEVTAAKILGVRSAVARRMASRRLIELGVPVRATTVINPQVSVSVTRDEAGNVRFSDYDYQFGGSWLATKAGSRQHSGPSDAAKGARLLIEQDIMSHSLPEHLAGSDEVVSDGED